MDTLFVIKEQITRFYTKFEAFIAPVLKFLATLIALLMINGHIGYMTKLKNPAIVLILALICSFMPTNVIILVAGLVIVGHVYALSLECAVVVLFVFIIMYALYFRFTPKDAIAALLTPICYVLKVPYIMPMAMGFVGTPLSGISVGCGTVVYYMLQYIEDHEDELSSNGGGLDAESALSGFKTIINGLIKNDTMIVMVITFAVAITVVYLVRRLRINYSWWIAMGVGSIVTLITLIVVNAVLDGDASIAGAILGIIVANLVCVVLQFFVFSVDYSQAEYVQFEDDDYYYYVKAVPKITAQAPTRGRRAVRRDWDEEDEDDY